MTQWNDRPEQRDSQANPSNLPSSYTPPSEPIYGEVQPMPEPQGYRLRLPLSKPIATWVLLVLNIVIFVVPALLGIIGVRVFGFSIDQVVLALGAKDNEAIKIYGQWYRLITAMFLHGSVLHIAFNSYALYSLGMELERLYGTLRFLGVYFVAGLAGSVASYLINPSPSVGASGAIFGLIGGLAAFYYVSREMFPDLARQQLGSLITTIMINLFIGFSSPMIDNSAHIGGLIVGAVVGWMLAPRFAVDTRLFPPVIVKNFWPFAWAGTAAIAVVLVVLAFTMQPPL